MSGEGAAPSRKAEDRSTGKLKSVNKTRQSQRVTPSNSRSKNPQKVVNKSSSPAKPSSKTNINDGPKTTGTIHSFFSAATQRLQSSQQPRRGPAPSVASHEELEAIDSDDEKAGTVPLSKSSNTSLAARKRKVLQSKGDFEISDELPPAPASQKFRKTSDSGRVASFAIQNDDKRPWIEQFAPHSLEDLAVHKRKVGDVRNWLETAYNGRRNKVLIMKGAAGTGKTATLNLLARDLGVEVTEWKNPAGIEYLSEPTLSATAQFEDFLGRAAKSTGLTFTTDSNMDLAYRSRHSIDDANGKAHRQLLLIEEFPSTFSTASPVLQSFRSAIHQYLASPPVTSSSPTPLVLIVSETLLSTNTAIMDSFTVHRLLGPELTNHPFVDTIEFNAVAPTILVKALDSIIVNEARKSGRRKAPGPLVLKQLAESGDIRSAIASLEFLCLRGDEGDVWSSKVAFSKPKKKTEPPLTTAEAEILKLVGNRESTLGIFHSVGKVVYNKRLNPKSELAQPPSWLPQHRRTKVPENDVNGLLDEVGTDTSTFIAALHENYALSCSSFNAEETLDSVCGCTESLSDADMLSLDRFSFGNRAFSGSATDSLRQDEMSFQCAVRGLLFSLPTEVHRSVPANGRKNDAYRMFYPASLRLWRRREEVEGTVDLLSAKLSSNDFNQAMGVSSPSMEGGGVASWKRDGLHQQRQDPASHKEDTIPASGTVAKTEMVTERLPYIAQILANRSTDLSFDGFRGQILDVTNVTGRTGVDDGDEDDADPPEDSEAAVAQQWATDRPEEKQGPQRLSSGKKRPQKAFETKGLGVPVERIIDKLVLEDDDIVDD